MRSEFFPQHVERLTQRRPRVALVELRPKQCQELIAALDTARRGGGEVREEGEAPGLAEQACGIPPLPGREAHGSEQPEFDHETAPLGVGAQFQGPDARGAVTAGVTGPSRSRDGSALNWLRAVKVRCREGCGK